MAELLCCCFCAIQCYLCTAWSMVKSALDCTIREIRKRPDDDTMRVAFTSCIHQRNPNLTFQHMNNINADVTILAGDNIYVDALPLCCSEACGGVGWALIGSGLCIAHQDPLLDWAQEYDTLNQRGGAEGLFVPGVMLATWDDHDFGGNDIIGANYPDKDKAKDAFVSWLTALDEKRGNHLTAQIQEISQPGRGIYYFYDHVKGNLKLRFYMLDNRYDRTVDDILGPAQWTWLEDSVRSSDAAGVTQHVFTYGSTMNVARVIGPNCKKIPSEIWPDASRNRFIKLISDEGIFDQSYLCSGDIHYSVVNLLETDSGPLYEFISSSHSHSVLTYIFNVYEWLVCLKRYICCWCWPNVTHGWPVDEGTNPNGFGILDISSDACVFSVLSQKEGTSSKMCCNHETEQTYRPSLQFQLNRNGTNFTSVVAIGTESEVEI